MARVDNFGGQRYKKIRKQLLEQKGLFQDSVFPPNATSFGASLVAKLNGRHVEWKRPGDLCDIPKLFSSDNFCVLPGEFSCRTMTECLHVFSTVRELCFKVLVNSGEQEWNPETYTGLFRFRFWRFGRWVDVVIDDLLPTVNSKLVFTQCNQSDTFLIPLLEKSYAKLLGSYEAIELNETSDILVDITGGVSNLIHLNSEQSMDEESRFDLFQQIVGDLTMHSVIAASIPVTKEEETLTDEGFTRGRMYSVTAAKKVHITDLKIKNLFKGRERVAVIRLRDPTGSINSAVSSPTRSVDSATESGDEINVNTSQLTKQLSKNVFWKRLRNHDRSRFGLDREYDSEIWIPFEDFVRYFSVLLIIRLYNNNLFTTGKRWHDQYLTGSWKVGERSGSGKRASMSFLRNPQYSIQIKQDNQEIVLQLLQIEQQNLSISLTVFEIEQNRKIRLHKQWGFTPTVVELDHVTRREISHRCLLRKGRYLVVPSTLDKDTTGSFILRVISHYACNLRELTVDIPSDFCNLSCISGSIVWVTVVQIKSIEGLPVTRNIFCTIKCEKEKTKTGLCKDSRNATWNEAFLFYRKNCEKPITIKVFSRNQLTRNQFLGQVEIQARVNHSPSILEVALTDKDGNNLPDIILKVEILTEDDLAFV